MRDAFGVRLTRTQRGRARRLRRRLAPEGLVVLSVITDWPPHGVWFRVGPVDGSRIGRHFRSMDADGRWDEWQSLAQARNERAATEASNAD
jgi:hypothetical protein